MEICFYPLRHNRTETDDVQWFEMCMLVTRVTYCSYWQWTNTSGFIPLLGNVKVV